MQFNVATLLQEPVGSTRVFTVTDEQVVVAEADFETRASGTVRLMRTIEGVLVRAELMVDAPIECSRCLEPTTVELPVSFAEEFAAARPGVERPPVVGPDQFAVDAQHLLDLSEPIRQYMQTALPLQPVCRQDCRGLCPDCGGNRNEQPCTCAAGQIDHRWGALASLAEQMRVDEGDGRTEA